MPDQLCQICSRQMALNSREVAHVTLDRIYKIQFHWIEKKAYQKKHGEIHRDELLARLVNRTVIKIQELLLRKLIATGHRKIFELYASP